MGEWVVCAYSEARDTRHPPRNNGAYPVARITESQGKLDQGLVEALRDPLSRIAGKADTLQAVTLVIQIALGIVLAVVILVFWRQLLALGVVLVVIAIIAIGLWLGWDRMKPVLTLLETKENFVAWATTVGIVSLLAWAVMRLTERLQKERNSSLEGTRSDEPPSDGASPKA